jgi:Na+/melibiose symporter-like transporter
MAGGAPVASGVISSILVVLGLIIFIAGIGWGDDDVTGVGGLLFVISLVLLFLTIFTAEPEHTRYKVTISDEVSMNDFLERYEIVDQEGKIYTVRERDGDSE